MAIKAGDALRKTKMKCPKCGYVYTVESEPYEIEHCPICGHKAPFSEFVQRVEIPK